MPSPPSFGARVAASCTKRSKMRSSASGAMPTPVSLTVVTTAVSSWRTASAISPPSGV